jgi:WD40 repeat protein
LHNESLEHDLGELQVRAKSELAERGQPYLCERFKVSRESPEQVRTLRGHRAAVDGVALSANGRLAVSASYDKMLKVWEVAMGRELRTFTGHGDRMHKIALSTDGRLAVSASDDKTLKVWDMATGCELRTLARHSDWVHGVALSTDARLAVSALYEHIFKVWDVATGRVLSTLSTSAPLTCCAMTLDKKTIVAGDTLGGTSRHWSSFGKPLDCIKVCWCIKRFRKNQQEPTFQIGSC